MMTSTREALLDAGVQLIAEQGFAAVTVGQIEQAAGFTPRGGTLYRHFRSKRELLEAALQRHVATLSDQRGLSDLLPLPDLASELRVIGRWILKRLDAEELISRVLEKEGHQLGELTATMREGISEPGYRLFAAYLDTRRAADTGLDSTAAAVMLVGALVNLRRSTWTFGRPPAGLDDDDALDAWVGLCVSELGGPPGALRERVLHDCAMAVLRNGNRVLLCHRHPDRTWIPNVWDFPGGHVEPGESPSQALVRELREELGIRIDEPKRPPDIILQSEEQQIRLAVWFIDYGGPVENRCPQEHDDIRWVAMNEASTLDLADDLYPPLIRRALTGSTAPQPPA